MRRDELLFLRGRRPEHRQMWSVEGTVAYHQQGVSDAKPFERCAGVVAKFVLGATTVLADSPHFLYANASISSGGA
jgi:hypothetical protein